jgi:zinc/manganese transport system substrate-binding protein
MRTVLVRPLAAFAAVTLVGLVAAGCGADAAAGGADGADGADGRHIVVTTSILGDVVANLVGDDAEIEVVMPRGVDPHDFAPSAKQAAAMRSADVLIVNGLGFEAGLQDTIDAAEQDGASVLTATDAVEPLPFGAAEHTDDVDSTDATVTTILEDSGRALEAADESPGAATTASGVAVTEDEPAGEDDAGAFDPHVFVDPARMAQVARYLGDELARRIDGLDTPAHQQRVEAYVAELEALDAEVAGILEAVPEERRVLVTNHEVFGYFADRYGFEVLGTVIPGGSTLAEASAGALDELAQAIENAQVPAIFAETSAPTRLADALAGEGAEVQVVELFTESLGDDDSDGATYVAMVRTNAQRIADALTP